MQAEKHLFATTPLLGALLRKRAVERLFSGNSREAALELAGAVEAGFDGLWGAAHHLGGLLVAQVFDLHAQDCLA